MNVTMTLSGKDARNASQLRERFNADSNAGAVSIALRVTAELIRATEEPDFECFLVYFPREERVDKLSITGLTN